MRLAASTPASRNWATWSRISAISGETTKREAAADDRRELEAERLAAARRHDREHVLARERGGEDVLLSGTKVREAEDGR